MPQSGLTKSVRFYLTTTVEYGGKWYVYGEVKACNEGWKVGLRGGSVDSKVAVLYGDKSEVYWTMGNASDWEGAWDAFFFSEP